MTERLWWQDGAFYQIYPRSYADSTGDGIGDLQGIRSKLDHLSWLGVDGIWLSPFFPSPQKDFGYDVADYTDVDPVYGTLDDYDALVRDCHERGLKVIIDFVPNHSSDQHRWFIESRSSRDNPKRDWYIWADPAPDGGPPNNWQSAFGGPAWSFDHPTGQYYMHSFLPEQPELNHRNPEVTEAIYDAMRFWLDRGTDGFRIDVVYRLIKDAQLRSNPLKPGADPATGWRSQEQIHSLYQPEVHEICRGFRRVLDSYDERMSVGEVTLLDPHKVASFYGEGDELHLAFNFHFCYRDWDAEEFASAIETYESVIPDHAWPCWVLSNHDVPRHAHRFGTERARAAATMLLTLRGTPFMYQGEEIGMEGCDPDEPLDMVGRDVCRTPMQWDASANAGFSTGQPWLRTAPDHPEVNVAAQRENPSSLLHLYRTLLALRKEIPALHRGTWERIDAPDGVLAYERAADGSRARVWVNFTSEPKPLSADGWRVRLATHDVDGDTLPADAAAILVPEG